MRLLRPLSYANVVSTLALVLAASGGAYAAGVVGPDGKVNGCHQKSNGQLRVVAAGDRCRSSEAAMAWNQAGPPGAQGPAGPKGDPGAPGAAGTAVAYAEITEDGTVAPGAKNFTQENIVKSPTVPGAYCIRDNLGFNLTSVMVTGRQRYLATDDDTVASAIGDGNGGFRGQYGCDFWLKVLVRTHDLSDDGPADRPFVIWFQGTPK